ncbi:MAG: hypothetical protein E7038_06865 [Lentisphaerae bacterium]|nr:hypothetical protein [Lentisphaerota bacterium]
MKKILSLALILGASGSLLAATPCKNCGVSSDNIIVQCEKGHISCSQCARQRNVGEQFKDSLTAMFGGGSGAKQRCTFVNRYDEACDGAITKKIADNRSPEKIRRENEIARQKAQRDAARKAEEEQQRKAGVNALNAEHNSLVKELMRIVRKGTAAQLKQHVSKMLNHYKRHNGFGGKAGAFLFGIGGTRGESCNILNSMTNTALRLKDDVKIQLLFSGISPNTNTIKAGLKTGKPVYVKLFANQLADYEICSAVSNDLIQTYCRTKNPNYILPLISQLQGVNFKNADFHNKNLGPVSVIFKSLIDQQQPMPLAMLKPFFNAVSSAELETCLTVMIAKDNAEVYRYLIDQKKVKGVVEIKYNGLVLLPYHQLIMKNDFAYAKKVKTSPTIYEDKINSMREEDNKKRDAGVTPIEYMAELNNFAAVKFLIEEEGYEFGTYSNYEVSTKALDWAEKHKNKEMAEYLDDKISCWTVAGVWTTKIVLLPLFVLVLLAGR